MHHIPSTPVPLCTEKFRKELPSQRHIPGVLSFSSYLSLNHTFPDRSTSSGVPSLLCSDRQESVFSSWVFVTVFYGVYRPAERTLTYVRAGHDPPRFRKAGDRVVTPLDGVGEVPLGILPGVGYSEASVRLASGDTILVYTDGITEAMNEANDLFGEERLDRLVASHGENAAALVARALTNVRAFEGARRASDDQTLLAVLVR